MARRHRHRRRHFGSVGPADSTSGSDTSADDNSEDTQSDASSNDGGDD
jgi:hypothetical protein